MKVAVGRGIKTDRQRDRQTDRQTDCIHINGAIVRVWKGRFAAV